MIYLKILIFNCFYCVLTVFADDLTEKLKYHEALDISDFKLQTQNRHKRDIFLNTNELKFNAFQREFHIYLKKDTHLLTDSVNIEVKYANRTKKILNDFITQNYYVGIVDNEPNSFVLLYYDKDNILNNGSIIYGKIELPKETFYIEPSPSDPNKFLVYKAKDVKSELFTDDGVFEHQKFCKQIRINETDIDNNVEFKSDINKREKRQQNVKKNRCRLALVADYNFFYNIGLNNEKLTTLNMINTISSVNAIFTKTNFDEKISDFGFDIDKIIVHAEPDPRPDHYNTESPIYVADNILELFGKEDWSQYCLAHLFTFKSFEQQVLGLAYVSSPRLGSYGGVCSPLMNRRGERFSSNTGLSSYKSISNSQTRLLQSEAELVTTHEFGHNWGSEHDPSNDRCTPSSSNGGNYIMYAYSNQGFDVNNRYFSPCSVVSMSEVIKTKSPVCFKEISKSFCGNGRVEEGEECDGGIDTRQNQDKCCDASCHLRANSKCSDANDECCTDCKYSSTSKVCFSSITYTECFNEKSYCTGISPKCPSQSVKPNGASCESYDSGKCNENGQCLSLCQQYNLLLLPCLCSDEEEKCMQCCQSTNTTCTPLHLIRKNNLKVYLSDGRSCLRGICKEGSCKVKTKDHVGRFWKIIEKIQVNSAVEFMKRNIVGTVIILSLLIWVPVSCCIHFCIDKQMRAEQDAYDAQYTEMVSLRDKKRSSMIDVVLDNQDRQLYNFSDSVE